MASTYSDLKFELIGTGEQSGTWGVTTNTNLGTAIEEAITGTADVTFSSSDVTLTLTDTNSSQTARNLRLNLTGTSGGARNLIVPSIQKFYLVNNGCADAVTVKNSTGTGIAVPAGKAMLVFNNATNVVDAITSMTSLTTASATITGGTITGITDLAIADGGTGASTASGARTNLGSTATGDALFTAVDAAAGRTTLGLGTIATQASNNVTITGGSITGITDLTVADGGTGASSFTANNVLLGNGTSSFQTVAPSTSGNVLTSNGTTWTSAAPAASGGFDAGTRMSFQQTTAPTGWTKDTTAALNDSLLRIVTGTASSGGSTAFSTFNSGSATGATTLSTAQIPSHTHTIQSAFNGGSGFYAEGQFPGPGNTGATGGGGSHTHTITRNVKYYDFIIASKN